MPASEDDTLLRARLGEIADAAGRAARMPAPATLRRHRRARLARRSAVGLSVVLGVAVAPAAVGADLSPFPVLGGGPGRSEAGLDPGPPVGTLSPLASPNPPRTPPSGAVGSGAEPAGEAEPDSAVPSAAPPPTATPGPSTAEQRGIWLSDGSDRDGAGCARPAWVSRDLDVKYPGLQAVRSTVAGPGPREADRGLRSAVKLAGLSIRSYGVVGVTATVDFDRQPTGAALPPRACRAAEILLPLQRTLTQFPNISLVRCSIRGSETAFYRDLLGIEVPD